MVGGVRMGMLFIIRFDVIFLVFFWLISCVVRLCVCRRIILILLLCLCSVCLEVCISWCC